MRPSRAQWGSAPTCGRSSPVAPLPAELHPFTPIVGAHHTAVATPGDLLLHIRSERYDLCFELERQLLDQFGDAVEVADETIGFRYFGG